jgi:ABC-2 type transport system permease protein
MTVFRTYVKRMIARPWMIAATVAVPLLIVVIVGSGGGNEMRVSLIDRDQSVLSRMVREAIDPVAHFVELDYQEITPALVDGRIEYALILPSGMQGRVIGGERARVETFSLQGVQMTRTVRSAADAVLSAAHNIANAVNGDREQFLAALERVSRAGPGMEIETYRGDEGSLSAGSAAGISQLIGLLTFTMFLTAMGTCLVFLKDVDDGIFHRTLAGPLSLRRYIAETNAAFICAALLQPIAAVGALRLVFPSLEWEPLLAVGAVLAAFALVAVSLALAVANTMKTVKRTAVTINIVTLFMVMLGGAFWPFEIMPEILQRIGSFSPVRWATSASAMALAGSSFETILPQLGVLVLFAVVFQLLGSWRRVDVSR